MALNEAEVNWRAFLKGLVDRGIHGIEFIVSDDHSGLKAARKAVFPGIPWQRCQFHLAQNAMHHAPITRSSSALVVSCVVFGMHPIGQLLRLI